jgi:hypothetical protein
VKNHDFTPKNHIFSIAEGGAKIFEVFRVKNHDFTPKYHIFSNFSGGVKLFKSKGSFSKIRKLSYIADVSVGNFLGHFIYTSK